jgi:glycosyltransferase involved in cell wall biosynthesis
MSARRVRVLEMIDRPFLGGGQVHVLTVAAGLNKDFFDVSISAGPGGPLATDAGRAGFPFVPAAMTKKLSRGTARAIAESLRERRIDILHTHGGVAGFFGRWAAGLARTPVVVHTLHGIHYLHYRNPFLREAFILQERLLARRTDAVIFVSEADAARGRKHRLVPEEKIRVIRNGIDRPNPGRAGDPAGELRSLIAPDGPLIGAVARLHRQKGIAHLLRAAPFVLARFPKAKIAVAGGGPLEAGLRREVERAGLGGRFLLLGERADAADLLALADVFVLPSLWEGLPLALLEAAALGKPIAATDIDGVREVVRDGETALLAPPADPGRLAAAVIRLLDDPGFAAAMGDRARAEISVRFTLSGMIGAIERLYLELATRKGVS